MNLFHYHTDLFTFHENMTEIAVIFSVIRSISDKILVILCLHLY